MKKTALSCALGLALGLAGLTAHAAAVNSGDTLTITTGVPVLTGSGGIASFSGSYFGMDTNGDSKVQNSEKTALSQGTTGLVIGTTTAIGSFHPGAPTAGDTNAIDKPWNFFGNTGSDYLTVAATGSTAAGLNLSGWTVAWATISAINMGGGAWQPLNCTALGCSGHTFTSGNAMFTWDGIYGDAYSLNYTATVPLGDPSGFGGVEYFLHLQGVVNQAAAAPVPVPAAVWLFGSGLLGLVGVARRKKKA